MPATLGAVAAFLVVLVLGLALHRPLARVPENTLKFIVGAMILSFGLFWTGEGLGLAWPGDDWSLPVMILAWLGFGLVSVQLVKPRLVRA